MVFVVAVAPLKLSATDKRNAVRNVERRNENHAADR